MSNTTDTPEIDQRTVAPESDAYNPSGDYIQTASRIREKYGLDLDAYSQILAELSGLKSRVFCTGYSAGYAQGAERQFEIGSNWSLAESLRS